MNLTQRLTEQNDLRSWRDCELVGLRHQLEAPRLVLSAYGTPNYFQTASTTRQCRRCPVSIYTRGR